MNIASAGSATEPLANGQIPASVRNKDDLPLPDGPCNKMRSPASACRVAPANKALPSGSEIVRLRVSTAAASCACRARFSTDANVMASSKPVKRSVVARHAARLL